MLTLAELAPGKTDRAAFIGQTGSGKTTLAHETLKLRPYVVALDPKGTLSWPDYTLITNLDDLMRSKANRLTYRPVYEELSDPEAIDSFFEWIYQRQATALYVDEVFAIARGDQYPWHFGACLTRGRERGVVVYNATQRPSRIPQVILSESEHYYCFNLKLPRDRQRVEETAGIEQDALKLPKHQFWYAPQDGEIRGPLKLELAKGTPAVVVAA